MGLEIGHRTPPPHPKKNKQPPSFRNFFGISGLTPTGRSVDPFQKPHHLTMGDAVIVTALGEKKNVIRDPSGIEEIKMGIRNESAKPRKPLKIERFI